MVDQANALCLGQEISQRFRHREGTRWVARRDGKYVLIDIDVLWPFYGQLDGGAAFMAGIKSCHYLGMMWVFGICQGINI